MPKALADFLGLVFFFWSNKSSGKGLEPIHIHVCKDQPTVNATKIWIRSDGILEVEHNGSQLSEKELKKALEYIKSNRARNEQVKHSCFHFTHTYMFSQTLDMLFNLATLVVLSSDDTLDRRNSITNIINYLLIRNSIFKIHFKMGRYQIMLILPRFFGSHTQLIQSILVQRYTLRLGFNA